MKIVVDLPNENYQVTLTKIMLACRGCSITELPKDHGRLIDADKLISSFPNYDGMSDVAKTIDYAPTVVEADKEMKE